MNFSELKELLKSKTKLCVYQFVLLIRVQTNPLALRKTERIQCSDERLLPRTLVPGVGQRSEV